MADIMAAVGGPLAEETARWVNALRHSVVLVGTDSGHGAGVVWDRRGLIVTNAHVVSRRAAWIETEGGARVMASVVARDTARDLALLRVPADGRSALPAAPIGNSRALRVGELIVAVGNPHGVRGTATLGIISAPPDGGRGSDGWLQADVALAPGSSGGPLANAWGEVVGIASMMMAPGIALAVPSHVVQEFVREALGLPAQQDTRQRAA